MTVYKGTRPRKLTPTQAARLVADVSNGMTKVAAAEKYGIGLRSVYRYMNRDDPKKRPIKSCGTNAGYHRHRYRKEPVCLPCYDAHAKDLREWKARKRRAA